MGYQLDLRIAFKPVPVRERHYDEEWTPWVLYGSRMVYVSYRIFLMEPIKDHA